MPSSLKPVEFVGGFAYRQSGDAERGGLVVPQQPPQHDSEDGAETDEKQGYMITEHGMQYAVTVGLWQPMG